MFSYDIQLYIKLFQYKYSFENYRYLLKSFPVSCTVKHPFLEKKGGYLNKQLIIMLRHVIVKSFLLEKAFNKNLLVNVKLNKFKDYKLLLQILSRTNYITNKIPRKNKTKILVDQDINCRCAPTKIIDNDNLLYPLKLYDIKNDINITFNKSQKNFLFFLQLIRD